MPDPKPQLSPEKQKQLKEATAFINDKVKKPGKFSIPKDMLDLLVESGEVKDVPKPEITKPESRPKPENQDITPELQEMVSDAEILNRNVFGTLYDIFPEHIPTPNFSPETMEFIRKGELAPFYLPEIDFNDLSEILQTIPNARLTKTTDIDRLYPLFEERYPNWCLPSKFLFELVQKYITTQGQEGVSPNSIKLTNQWVAIETVEKPNYDLDDQRYQSTDLMNEIGELMDQDGVTRKISGVGAKYLTGSRLKMGDRFSLEWSEVTGIMTNEKGHAMIDLITNQPMVSSQGIAIYAEKVLNSKVSLPTHLQWNLLANLLIHNQNQKNNQPIRKPDSNQGLGSTNISEWSLDERYNSGDRVGRLICGDSSNNINGPGGLSSIGFNYSYWKHQGFRLLVTE